MSRGGREGFTLVELLVALTILAVGLLGCVGTLLSARRALGDAERLHVASQTAADVADSLLAQGMPGAGERTTAWGRIVWSGVGAGTGLRAETGAGEVLLEWWIPDVQAIR